MCRRVILLTDRFASRVPRRPSHKDKHALPLPPLPLHPLPLYPSSPSPLLPFIASPLHSSSQLFLLPSILHLLFSPSLSLIHPSLSLLLRPIRSRFLFHFSFFPHFPFSFLFSPVFSPLDTYSTLFPYTNKRKGEVVLSFFLVLFLSLSPEFRLCCHNNTC